jgi:hypothetical protein
MSTFDPISKYIDAQGRITRWPGQKYAADRQRIIAYLAQYFEFGRDYTEREVNELLQRYHTFDDWALLRRELFEQGFLNREKDGSRYWRTPHTNFY